MDTILYQCVDREERFEHTKIGDGDGFGTAALLTGELGTTGFGTEVTLAGTGPTSQCVEACQSMHR